MGVRTQSQPAAAPQAAATPQPLAVPTVSGDALILEHIRGPWTWMASRSALTTYRGQIVPDLAKALHEQGTNGNPPAPNDGRGMSAWMERDGWLRIPYDLPGLVAFGVQRDLVPGLMCRYLDRHSGKNRSGQAVETWTDAWTRPKRLGALTIWERDDEGWQAFLARVLALIQDGQPLAPEQVQIALAGRLRAIQGTLDKPEGHARTRRLREHAAHLPIEYHPPELRAVLGAASPQEAVAS